MEPREIVKNWVSALPEQDHNADVREDAYGGTAVGTFLRVDLEHFVIQLGPGGLASCVYPNIFLTMNYTSASGILRKKLSNKERGEK